MLFFSAMVHQLNSAEQKNLQLYHSKEVLTLADGVLIDSFEGMGYLLTFLSTFDESSRREYIRKKNEQKTKILALEKLIEPESPAFKTMTNLKAEHRELMAEISRATKEDKTIGAVWNGFEMQAQIRMRLERIINLVKSIIRIEQLKVNELKQEEQVSKELLYWLVMLGFCLDISLTIALANFFYRSLASRVAQLAQNTVRLGSGQELLPELTGSDELVQLDRSIREMSSTINESVKKERALVESSRDIICSLDEALRLNSVNPIAEEQLGFSQESLLGKRFIELVDEPDRTAFGEAITKLRDRSKQLLIECNICDKDRNLKHFRISGYYARGEEILVLVMHDITDKKIAQDLLESRERRMRSLFDQMPVALFVLDTQARIESCNLDAAHFLECRKEDVEGQPFTDFITSQSQSSWREAFDSFQYESKRTSAVVFLQSRRQSLVPLELSLSRYELGGQPKFLVAGLNITERLKHEQLKRDFVNMVSHDIRSPVTSIIAFLEMLQSGKFGTVPEEVRRRLFLTIDSANRLVLMVSELLDLEKMEARMIELNKKETSVAATIRKAIDSVAGFAERSEVYLSIKGTEAYAHWDEARIIQVLINLIANAIKYSPRQGEVEIRFAAQGDGIEISVIDQGEGIEEAQIPVLFEKFRQAKNSSAEPEKGSSGLGLAIAKALVECHEGKIGVTSRRGKGSCFWFLIPNCLVHKSSSLDQPVNPS